MQGENLVNGHNGATQWHAINWRSVFRVLKNLRGRIFRAAKEGNYKKLRSLQKLMLRSYANIVVSVRKVTQVNVGKNTAGVDKAIVKTATERGKMVDDLLSHQPWKAKPAKRIYIPKANGKYRPLGIPVIKERCLQTMIVNALEPEWESQFETSSYGFRPGRSCHDAIERIYRYARPNSVKQWIIDADIKGAFDNIDHNFLLERIGNFPGKALIQQWLKAGYMEGNVFFSTEKGTPQGGCCSPLLANIALHGMEEVIGMKYNREVTRTYGERKVVRYADDFVVFCATEQDAQQTIVLLQQWLKDRGLELSQEKTRIRHLTQGFDFLGFNICMYPTRNSRTGFKTLIKPSRKSILKIRDRLKEEWISMKSQCMEIIIRKLNPIIRGWANYFRTEVSKEIFGKLDMWMFTRQVRYVRRMHPEKNYAWKQAKYWGRLNLDRQDHWVFGDKKTGMHLLKFSWFKIERHILVQGFACPDDPTMKIYWKERQKRKAFTELVPSKQRIAKSQHYLCPVCKTSLFNEEQLHVHHVKPKSLGGSDAYTNLKLLHANCHQQIHSKHHTAGSNELKPT